MGLILFNRHVRKIRCPREFFGEFFGEFHSTKD